MSIPFTRFTQIMALLMASTSMEQRVGISSSYKSRGHGGKHSPNSSRPTPRLPCKNKYAGIVGAHQAGRNTCRGMHNAIVNGFEIIQTRSIRYMKEELAQESWF